MGDKYEQEADQVAKDVVQQINTPQTNAMPKGDSAQIQPNTLQRQQTDKKELQLKQLPEMVQRREAIARGEASTDLANSINSARSGGQPLDRSLQQSMGQAMGTDFSGVRVHTDAQADQLNQSIQAKAFTTGQDVFFRQGEYQPGSKGGQELIAHELTHVVQQNGDQTRCQKHQKNNESNSLEISSIDKSKIQRKFGFEIEIPIFLTYEDTYNPPLGGASRQYWTDASSGPGGGNFASPSNIFDLHVDHNMELDKLAQYEEQQSGLAPLFPSHASIIEVVTKAWDEQTLTRSDMKLKASAIVNYIKRLKTESNTGKVQLDNGAYGNYWIGSDMPGAGQLQSTLGYFQSTYGIKISQIPKLFEQTTKKNSNVNDHKFLKAGVAAADQVIRALNWQPNVATDSEIAQLQGYLTLICNYLIVGKDNSRIGLAKNTIGEYFYKSDLGKLRDTLPSTVKSETAKEFVRADIIFEILKATERELTQDVLSGTGIKCGDWLDTLLQGNLAGSDDLLNAMKNQYSQELGPENIGRTGSKETGVVVENRELQYLDPNYRKRQARYDRQKSQLFAGPKLSQAELSEALATLDDPKKYPIDDWERIILIVYDLVRSINR
ncbi:DUF4157 domain-containing protein [Nostoc sp. UHCC 0251]|uniref:eCIS core domain-containing protein n=1 Tax=Nostoc sp. UHCC 0251 TaxID=3110240 RepID=UPI002B20867D|nr:DUF4157 domain-containing protein [Nostoc sp. UHCC 0251]MEA5627800.1 DUF4157 domain-containing protein [Nostoc sp. UHCC 0251]